jgi:hypothetical protein
MHDLASYHKVKHALAASEPSSYVDVLPEKVVVIAAVLHNPIAKAAESIGSHLISAIMSEQSHQT